MAEKAHILVVDDEVPVGKSICSALQNSDYVVDMVLSGEDALEKERPQNYDVIITDLMMPGMSGMELLKALKNIDPIIQVIMITGYPSIKTAVQSVKLGAFDYLPKPFTPNELRGLVTRAIERRQLLKKARTSGIEKTHPNVIAPPDLYCILEHSWARVQEDGLVQIGMHYMYKMTIEKIQFIEFPQIDDFISQGEVSVVIHGSENRVYKLWMPVSGKVVAVNEDLKKDYSVIDKSPYEKGWMLTIEPSNLENDKKNLIST